jgi:hypothetical protein
MILPYQKILIRGYHSIEHIIAIGKIIGFCARILKGLEKV